MENQTGLNTEKARPNLSRTKLIQKPVITTNPAVTKEVKASSISPNTRNVAPPARFMVDSTAQRRASHFWISRGAPVHSAGTF